MEAVGTQAVENIEREFGDLWEEISAPVDKPDAAPEAPPRRNHTLDIDPMRAVCRCWRCRAGGVAVSDMGPMDRILARHLLRMPTEERDGWMRLWAANANHGPSGKRALEAWMAIEQGENRPEPSYFARKAIW